MALAALRFQNRKNIMCEIDLRDYLDTLSKRYRSDPKALANQAR
jgi:hypothetical protein